MKNLYKYAPVFIQNIIITIVNNQKYYQKYGAIPYIKPLKRIILNLDISNINDEYTVDRINKLLSDAVLNVPYYRENKENYQPISNINDIKNLPVLRKKILKEHNDKFISEKSNRYNSYYFKTSGSTGTPLWGAISLKELRVRFDVFLASLKSEGIDYSLPVARFLGANVAEGSSIVFRKYYVNNHLLFSIYDLSKEKIIEYHKALVQNKIRIIEGYPSTIYSLVKLLKEQGLNIPSVTNVLTTAEKLLDYQKEEIEGFFNLKIFDYYGSSEGSTYMYLNKKGFYLNSNKIGYLETVNHINGEVKGTAGKMLVTSFSSSFTPLIRYDIGDICTIKEEKNEVIKVSEIIGRQDDVYITPNGTEFSRFSLVLKYLPEVIQESQLRLWQNTNKAEVHYLSKLPIASDDFYEFQDKIETILKMKFDIKYIRKQKFEKLSRGKLTAVKIMNNEN